MNRNSIGREMNLLQKFRLVRLLALMLALVFCLSACSGVTQSSPELKNVELPEPAPAQPRQILGDNSTTDAREITLHYASENSVSLTTVTRTINVGRDESLVYNTLVELLSAEHSDIRRPVEANLVGLEYGSGVATVNLSIEAGVNRSDQDYLTLCASIANTLLGIEGVEAVNVLTGNRSDPVARLPLGSIIAQMDNLPAAYAQAQSEAQRILDDENGALTRNVLLYFPAQGGEYLLPEVRALTFENDDYTPAIIAALGEGPLGLECCFGAIPGNLELLAAEPRILATGEGERVIELNFTSTLANYLAFAGVEPWQLYGSIVLSLCSFVPEIDAVRISIEDEYVSDCSMYGNTLSFDDGLMRRRDFAAAIGSSARLYFANEAGSLSAVECPMSQSAANSAMGLLSELASSTSAYLPGTASVFPEGIAQEDILGVTIENRTAVVNLSGNFYARCQALSPQQERLLVYAMVNTLAQLEHIGAVAFRVEGELVDSLAQNIYLKTALMPDPGLVQEKAQPEDAGTLSIE